MIVVADASPINYLVLIAEIDVLRQLYGGVAVPSAVHDELTAAGAPEAVRTWSAGLPDWVTVRSEARASPADLELLDRGEAEAIALAEAMKPEVLLLIDERKGRQEAVRRGMRITGTLGVLNDAAKAGLLDLPSVLQRLGQTTFRAAPSLLSALLEQDRRRT